MEATEQMNKHLASGGLRRLLAYQHCGGWLGEFEVMKIVAAGLVFWWDREVFELLVKCLTGIEAIR